VLTGKYFSLTNFLNGKQTHESLKTGFSKTSFEETNTALICFYHMTPNKDWLDNYKLINTDSIWVTMIYAKLLE
jgi:hypothetical protein